MSSVIVASLVAAYLSAGSVSASEVQDCAAYANSMKKEPAWYSQKCLGHPYGAKAPKAAAAGTAPAAIGDPTFQFNMRTGGTGADSLQTFPLPQADTATIIGPQTGNIYGLEYDRDSQTLFGVSDTLQFGVMSGTDGSFTPSVTLTGVATGHSPTGLAFLSGTSTHYLSTSDGTVSNLYTFDPATGAATLVGAMGTPLVIDIAINAGGQMYAHDISTDSIYSVNTTTGAMTLIGATGVNANFAQGMSFDRDTGVLYAWLYEGSGVNRFASINLTTGAATTVATPLPGEYEGATTPVSLQSFSVD